MFVVALGVEDIYKGQHILQRDVALEGVGWGENIAAEKAFREMKARGTRIASITKREEEIFLQGSPKPLKLPSHSPVRKLLQYVRDEAHRFAQHYHHILRTKKIIGKNR